MKLEELQLGVSADKEGVFAGKLNKAGTEWIRKQDITNQFLDCVVKRFEGHSEEIQCGTHVWEISVKKVADKGRRAITDALLGAEGWNEHNPPGSYEKHGLFLIPRYPIGFDFYDLGKKLNKVPVKYMEQIEMLIKENI